MVSCWGNWIRGLFFLAAVGKVAGEREGKAGWMGASVGVGGRGLAWEGSRGRGGAFVKWNLESGVGTWAKYRVYRKKMGFVRPPDFIINLGKSLRPVQEEAWDLEARTRDLHQDRCSSSR